MDPRISECWQELSDFITFRSSLDQGALSKLHQLLTDESVFDPPVFSDQITTFLTAVTSQPKQNVQGSTEVLAMLAVDSLISNLYLSSRNEESFQPRSSSFYGWMSSSQMSMDYSNAQERQGQVITEWITELANSESFFKRLKTLIEKKNQQRVKKYAECLLETIDTVLGREKLSRQTFQKLRGKYVGLESRRKWEVDYPRVNSVIFSSQLNKIMAVLTEGGDSVHLALLRIYLSCSHESKSFEGARFTGDEMLTNLYRYYVNSFKQMQQLFQEGKHPLFRFLRNHLALLFTPSLRKFHQLIAKISPKCGHQPGFAFFKNGSAILQAELTEFINDLPGQLFKLLSLLKQLVEEQHPGQSQFALSAVKKLFFYSFLVNQTLIEELNPRHDPGKWGMAYNHILTLFFQGSIKKYANLTQSQQNQIGQLIQTIAGHMDNRIVNQYIQLEDEALTFRITDTIVNHDYEVVLEVLASLEFTPKDSKQFEMKKIINVAPESPVYKQLKGQQFSAEENQEELELATWMSVGGSREWGAPPSRKGRGGVAERLKGFKTISSKMKAELQEESATWGAYLKG